ncbi:hypothetical protein [Clostridium uliginosum]|uniref:Uncharacterized protein n=1 Tax=Clostridium uliginosum TaxID=119641 RepID=A0A1I1RBT4_9CLOT|nr:hypothetical protein [Clostridium uliginosum]SFD31846.1 hypothetical protein SAMN05421842_1326 [Clostridium uliginosum]
MLDDIFHIVLYGTMLVINAQSFYKGRKIYNLLFCMFFTFELLRIIFLEKYLISNVGTVVMFIEAVVLISAIILFFQNKSKINNN